MPWTPPAAADRLRPASQNSRASAVAHTVLTVSSAAAPRDALVQAWAGIGIIGVNSVYTHIFQKYKQPAFMAGGADSCGWRVCVGHCTTAACGDATDAAACLVGICQLKAASVDLHLQLAPKKAVFALRPQISSSRGRRSIAAGQQHSLEGGYGTNSHNALATGSAAARLRRRRCPGAGG